MNLFDKLPIAREEDKPILFTLIKYLYVLSMRVRREGILSIVDDLENEHITLFSGKQPFIDYPVLETFILHLEHLVADAHDSERIADIARYAFNNFEDDSIKLTCMIATEGIISIQTGLNREDIRYRLSSMLGVRMMDDFLKETEYRDFLFEFIEYPPIPDETTWNEEYGKEWAQLVESRKQEIKIPFEQFACDESLMKKTLRIVDWDELVYALIPSNAKELRDIIFHKFSEEWSRRLQCDMRLKYPYNLNTIFESQLKIMSSYQRILEYD